MLAGLHDSEDLPVDDDWEVAMVPGLPVDRWSDPLPLWRPFPCLNEGGDAATASGPVDLSSRVDDGGEVVHALALLRVFDADRLCLGADCWYVAGLLLVVLLAVLGPPKLRASSSPPTPFEPVTDLLLGRLTLGDAMSPLSHRDSSSTQLSAPSAPSCGEKGGGKLLSESAGESVERV